MKTRLYTTDYPPARGGVARYLGGLVRYFQGSIGVEVAPAGTRWWQAARWFVTHRAEYDQLLVSHVLPIGTAAWMAKFVTRKPYVVIVHGMDVGFAKRNAVKRFVAGCVLRGAKLVVANSMALEREVTEAFGVERSMVVYPCVREADGAPAAEHPIVPTSVGDADLRSGHLEPCSSAPIRLLTVARLVPRKGHLRVLDAIQILKARHPELRLSYEIVGDGPEHEQIASHIRDLKLQDVVRITKDMTDDRLPTAYETADIFIMPVISDALDREGFGTVYLEAALHGVPSIATWTRGVDEAVIDGKTGLLVADGHVDDLADAIYFLSTDLSLRQQLGVEARARCVREFVPSVQFEKLRYVLG
ncbi:glycosyltransferase family 1 protein [bacterium]|nr:glycosyltransferase family 1 protein [bacterium]